LARRGRVLPPLRLEPAIARTPRCGNFTCTFLAERRSVSNFPDVVRGSRTSRGRGKEPAEALPIGTAVTHSPLTCVCPGPVTVPGDRPERLQRGVDAGHLATCRDGNDVAAVFASWVAWLLYPCDGERRNAEREAGRVVEEDPGTGPAARPLSPSPCTSRLIFPVFSEAEGTVRVRGREEGSTQLPICGARLCPAGSPFQHLMGCAGTRAGV